MAQDFNTGRDANLDIIDPIRGPLRFKIRTGFEQQALTNELASKGMDGITRRAVIPDGHRLTFMFDRAGPEIDDYFAAREEDYFNGAVLPDVTITQTVKERNGRISQWRYTEVTLRPANGGTWRGDGITTQTIEATASRKRKIA